VLRGTAQRRYGGHFPGSECVLSEIFASALKLLTPR
jgi:hypothetical protein